MKKTVLYLMLGYPGAGKTTTAKVIHDLTGAVHVSSDEMRLKMFPHPSFSQSEHDQLYRYIDREVEQLLRAGNNVIYDANLNRHRHRQEKYDMCARVGARPLLIWVQTAKELAKSRAVHHSRSQLVPHNESPAEMFDRIARVIEEPHPNEKYISVDGTKVTADYVRQLLQD